MEVKPGYKQTEVGVIPEDWEVKRLGEVVDTDPENLGSDTAADFAFNYIALEDVDRGILRSHAEQVFRNAPSRARRKLRPNDVLVSTVRPNLQSHLLFEGAPGRWVSSTGFCVVRCREGVAHPGFVLLHFFAGCVNRQIDSLLTGSNYPAINSGDVRALKIPFPVYPEQRAIATALSDVDGLVGGLSRLIAKKRDLKLAAMQQLLTGQTRLPGFQGEWEMKTLKNILQTPVTDGPHLTPQFLNDGVPFLSVNNLVDNKINLSDLRFISRTDHEVFSRKCKPRMNDILMGKAASVGKVALVELDIEFNIWSPIAMIRINCDNAPRFVYFQLQSADLVRQITLLTNSSSQGNIGMGEIEKLTLKLPPLPEQTAIAEVLTAMDVELAALEQRREKTQVLKQAMMQELLTGRTRLVSPVEAHA